MTTRWFGAPVQRKEDERLLRGQGRFTDDIDGGALAGCVVRSQLAHARITSVDTAAARSLPGVHAVYTAGDLPFGGADLPLLIPHPSLTHGRTQRCLASEVVRYVGEAIAFVVADDRETAEDAADLVEVGYAPLPPVVTPETSVLAHDLVHDDVPGNVAATLEQEVGDVGQAFAAAAHVIERRYRVERSAGQPLEGRAVWAGWDARERRLLVYDSTQAPIAIRGGLAALFGLPETSVEVVAPDVGGAFGPKIMLFYPEEVLVPFAAMRLDRPVKWTEDRREHFISTNHERAQVHEARCAFDAEGRVLAFEDEFINDAGAYAPYGIVLPLITAAQLPGPYDIGAYRIRFRDVYTTTVPTSPYRGAGRPHACFVIERLMDAIAAELGLSRAEVRHRNLLRPDAFPREVGLQWQDGGQVVLDSGNYPELLARCQELLGPRPAGDHVGMGLAMYIEGTGVGPYEGAHVRVLSDGRVAAATGTGTQGQSHETVFAQIVADELGVGVEDVDVVTGDTRRMSWGVGTFASRSAVFAGNAFAGAARAVAARARAVASEQLEVDPEDLELAGGMVRVKGVPERGLPLGTVAVLSNPLRYAFGAGAEIATQFQRRPRPGSPLRDNQAPGLEAWGYWSQMGATWASGCHACWVRVDPETFRLRILRYAVVHDCGRVINPAVVAGQIQGGVAQGIGGAFYERIAYGEDGQLRNASFMEFLMPYATEVPEVVIDHLETPSPLNPLGVKGAGEAGTIPVAAAIAAGIEEALGVPITEVPLSPLRLYQLSRAAGESAPGGPG
ncbi:MAG: aerobic carbon-monoxide dehydrogenase large subunit [Candidatus Dormibacteraceae bacterium]